MNSLKETHTPKASAEQALKTFKGVTHCYHCARKLGPADDHRVREHGLTGPLIVRVCFPCLETLVAAQSRRVLAFQCDLSSEDRIRAELVELRRLAKGRKPYQ